MRAGALHHVGILEATSVSLPASLPWDRIRDTINLSQDLMLKCFILAWNYLQHTELLQWFLVYVLYAFLFVIVCWFQIGGGIQADCRGTFSTMNRGQAEFRICQDSQDRHQPIVHSTVIRFQSHVPEYPYMFLSAQCRRNIVLKHFWEVCNHTVVTLVCVQGQAVLSEVQRKFNVTKKDLQG